MRAGCRIEVNPTYKNNGGKAKMDVGAVADAIKLAVENVLAGAAEDAPEVTFDDDGEPTSLADLAVESALRPVLARFGPGAEFLSEEDFRTRGRSLESYSACDELWIVDPIDGTSGLISGSDRYGTIVSFAKAQTTVASWIFTPALHRMCVSEAGSGCWLDGARCSLETGMLHPQSGVLATGDFNPAELRGAERLRAMLQSHRRTDSCALDYIDLVTGQVDVALYKRTRPWDHAGGVLAHTEAGGRHVSFEGLPYQLLHDNQGLLLAPNRAVLEDCFALLRINPSSFAST